MSSSDSEDDIQVRKQRKKVESQPTDVIKPMPKLTIADINAKKTKLHLSRKGNTKVHNILYDSDDSDTDDIYVSRKIRSHPSREKESVPHVHEKIKQSTAKTAKPHTRTKHAIQMSVKRLLDNHDSDDDIAVAMPPARPSRRALLLSSIIASQPVQNMARASSAVASVAAPMVAPVAAAAKSIGYSVFSGVANASRWVFP